MSGRASSAIAAGVALTFLALSVALAPAYGPVWDTVLGEYPHGEAFLSALTGHGSYLEHAQGDTGQVARQPHPDFDFDQRLPWIGSYPLTGLVSAISCRVLWTGLGWLPALQAHDLPVALLVALMLFVIVRVAGARFGPLVGVSSALFLACAPRWFAHSFNNLKDVPEACLYCLAILAQYRALVRGGWRRWLLAGVLIGLALAQRPNALFVPVQMALFLVGAVAWRAWRGEARLPWSWGGLALALTAFFVTWFAFSPAYWPDPAGLFDQLQYHLQFNAFVGNERMRPEPGGPFDPKVSAHGLLMFVGTTPPATLLLGALGLFSPRLRAEERLLLALGVAVPVGRTLVPGMANYDGVRHFLEALPPLAVLAALGLQQVVDVVGRVASLSGGRGVRALQGAVALALVAPPVVATATTHPDGITYFNAFLGGLPGAQERRIPDATDYWCNTYWRGLDWLSRETEGEAVLYVPIAGHVARCAAPLRLRPGVHVEDVPPRALPGPLFVMYVTRRPAYGPLLRDLDATHEPVFEIQSQGAPILRILRLDGAEAEAALGRWQGESQAWQSVRRIKDWVEAHEEHLAEVMLLVRSPEAHEGDRLRRLREILPPELHADAAALLTLWGVEPASDSPADAAPR